MTRGVRFLPEATQELVDAALWYEGRRVGLGAEFLESVETALAMIARWPNAAPRAPFVPEFFNIRRTPVSRFPYGIVYVTDAELIRVLAIAHDARQPFYWSGR